MAHSRTRGALERQQRIEAAQQAEAKYTTWQRAAAAELPAGFEPGRIAPHIWRKFFILGKDAAEGARLAKIAYDNAQPRPRRR